MYATISDLLKDLFGFYLPLPIQTFGFFLGLSFLAAYWATSSELKRKEAEGLLKALPKTIRLHVPKTNWDYLIQILFGAAVGYKVLEMVLHYDELLADTQGFILSSKGNFVGALIGASIAYYFTKKEDQEAKKHTPTEKTVLVHPYEHMGNILMIAAVAGLLGAKLFHNLENLDDLMADPIGALLSFSGLTFYGGLIVATIMILRYTSKNGIDTKLMIDAAAPALILAYGIGRLGCHLSGDGDWGIVNTLVKPDWLSALPDWLWKYNYPNNVLGEGIPIPNCEGKHCFMLPEAVYPTPLYEAIMSFLIFGILWVIRKRLRIPGMLFSIYLVFNGTERFLIEKIRVNTTYSISGNQITQAEIISSMLIILGIVGVIYLARTKQKPTE